MEKRNPKIYDCVIFDNENELFSLRLNYLSKVVDIFVVVEGEATFQGQRKNLNFYSKFKELPNVNYFVIPYSELIELSTPWDREYYTRNYIKKALKKISATDFDLVLIGDVDEIPSKNIFLKKIDDIFHLEQIFCSYYFNYYNFTSPLWRSSYFAPFGVIKDKDLNIIRFDDKARKNIIPFAGWHFSYLGNVENVIAKIEKFSENQFNTPTYKNKVLLTKKIRYGIDLYDRNMVWRTVSTKEHITWDIYPLLEQDRIASLEGIETPISVNSNIRYNKILLFRFLKKIHAYLIKKYYLKKLSKI